MDLTKLFFTLRLGTTSNIKNQVLTVFNIWPFIYISTKIFKGITKAGLSWNNIEADGTIGDL
jgi:hypothetical protein